MNLDGLDMTDTLELVELSQDTLDDVWKQTEYDSYPEARMRHLMEIIGELVHVLPNMILLLDFII